jgi:mono/diheme cytochrome c family protein
MLILRMKVILFASISVLGLLAACTLLDPNPGPLPVSGPTVPNTPVNMTVDTSIGHKLYVEQCARCHGDSAQGTAQFPKNLQGTSNYGNIVHHGSGLMPAYPTVSDSDIKSIELYLSQFKNTQQGSMSGMVIYQTYCASCHGDSAQGTAGKGKGIQSMTRIDSVVHHGNSQTMPAYQWVTDAQMRDLEAYLGTFAMPTDGPGLYKFYCASCHGAAGVGDVQKGIALQQYKGISSSCKNGTRIMPKVKNITDPQIALIEQYLGTLKIPTDGGGLYSRYCAQCHGLNALGDSSYTPGLAGAAMGADLMWITTSKGSSLARTGHSMAAVPEVTQPQTQLITAYLGTVNFSHDGATLYLVNCRFCHGTNTGEARGDNQSQFTGAVQGGRGRRMYGYPNMSTSDIAAMYGWVSTH